MPRVSRQALTLLKFERLDLQPNTSATYLPALASTLRSLRSLSHLKLHGLLSWESGHVDSTGFGAGCALVAAIATLSCTRSRCAGWKLWTRATAAGTLRRSFSCSTWRSGACQFGSLLLARFKLMCRQRVRLTSHPFVHLLAHMTRLQTLALVRLDFRDAMRVFSDVLPTLADLRTLNIWALEFGPVPLVALAHICRQVPNLQVLCGDADGYGYEFEGVHGQLSVLLDSFARAAGRGVVNL